MKYKLTILTAILLITTIGVSGLFIATNRTLDRNNFSRIFKPNSIKTALDTLELGHKGKFYIAGMSTHHIYLAKSPMSPIIVYNVVKRDSQHLRLQSAFRGRLKSGRLLVDSPNYFIQDNIDYELWRGNFSNRNDLTQIQGGIFFSNAVPISNITNIIRTFKDSAKELCIAKSRNNKVVQKNLKILKKQVDGIFCTDGMINYDRPNAKIVYLYYYRNQYIQFDTNLNVLSRATTIDSNTHAKIRVERMSSKSFTLSAPPLIVNKKSCISDNMLFVNSPLLSSNEPVSEFKASSVIDVYDLRTNKYKYSFYIPDFNEEKINDFIVKDDKLVALYTGSLLIYQAFFAHN